MGHFRKKPVVIEAWQWHHESTGQLRGVCNCHQGNWGSHLHTMHEGQIVMLKAGDWIIPEPDGEHYYPCNPEVFANTYEPVEPPAMIPLLIIGATLIAIGAIWWCRVGVGAERPASLLALVGLGLYITGTFL